MTAETTADGVVVPMAEPCCAVVVIVQAGHHVLIEASNDVSKSTRMGKIGSVNS